MLDGTTSKEKFDVIRAVGSILSLSIFYLFLILLIENHFASPCSSIFIAE